jgi:hypothetical protein
LNQYSNKNIIALTEAPDYNIIDWSTKIYELDFSNSKKMIKTGYHNTLEWETVIF